MHRNIITGKHQRDTFFSLDQRESKNNNFGTKVESQMADDEFQDAPDEFAGSNQMISGIFSSILSYSLYCIVSWYNITKAIKTVDAGQHLFYQNKFKGIGI